MEGIVSLPGVPPQLQGGSPRVRPAGDPSDPDLSTEPHPPAGESPRIRMKGIVCDNYCNFEKTG